MKNITFILLKIFVICFIETISCNNAYCGQVKSSAAENKILIPYAEQTIPAEEAEEWIIVSPDNNILEGAIFDNAGNMLFCDVTGKKVMKMTPDKKLSTELELSDLGVGGLAYHKDGRLFMAALDLVQRKGAILSWSPETKKLETIIPADSGFWPNDLVFDNAGGFYFSDFRGSATKPDGGIYYVSPDFKTITPVIANMAQTNGVALSPDGKVLWATEFATNRLHRSELEDPITVSVTGSSIPWYFTGPAPDSMRVDAEGNVYVAIYGQGRIMMFNSQGIPLKQILLPEREKGLNLLSTSVAINPNNDELFIVSSNNDKNQAAKVFKAHSLNVNKIQ